MVDYQIYNILIINIYNIFINYEYFHCKYCWFARIDFVHATESVDLAPFVLKIETYFHEIKTHN